MATQASSHVEPHKPEALPKASIVKTEDGHRYVHGDLSFPITAEPGKIGEALQQADEIGEGPARRLMELNGMPVQPWSWRLARPLMLSYVQLVWHRHQGADDAQCVKLVQKLNDRQAHYQQEVAKLAVKPPKAIKAVGDSVRGGGSTRNTPQHVGGMLYVLRPDRKEIWEKFNVGQKKVLIDKMVAHGEPVSSTKLAELLVADGFKASQPVERVTSFYFAEWKRNGLLQQVEPLAVIGEASTEASAEKSEIASSKPDSATKPAKKESAKKK